MLEKKTAEGTGSPPKSDCRVTLLGAPCGYIYELINVTPKSARSLIHSFISYLLYKPINL